MDKDKPAACGAWCPLFGEPVHMVALDADQVENVDIVRLELCRTKLAFDTFTDEREDK